MLVVTDTSPINYLILIGYVDVLPVLHGDIIIPQAVAVELMNPQPLTHRSLKFGGTSQITLSSGHA
jgi:predicted nucleic acid-binding protein